MNGHKFTYVIALTYLYSGPLARIFDRLGPKPYRYERRDAGLVTYRRSALDHDV